MSHVHRMERVTEIAAPLEEVFSFFSDAENLETISPPWLRFRITTPGPIIMKEGALIRYRLRLRMVPISWTTRITAWQPPHRFVDEQLSGPFRMWVHEHTFEERNGRTLARDRVDYIVPGGAIVHRLFVRPDLEKIFSFRENILRQLGRP